MDAKLIREKFIHFFQNKQHQLVTSAPIVVKNDPTLMFTNAGMNQFKDYFLGNETPKSLRIANSQKCLRVSGKHNDLEEVGVDTYHHTMFEMMGNWSFGDYFKKEAIAWAWELLTEEYGLEKDRLYITVFGGDEAEGLEKDQEALDLWKNWIAEDRILYGSKKDNFWEMGETGPCGPCSEIHIDIRPEEERRAVDGKTLVNEDHPQVIEIWNLVFIQYNRMANGSLTPLPAKHVDTGMGLERLVRVIQGKFSNYDTDLFIPFIRKVEELCGKKYGKDEKTDIAFRVIVDHIRAIAFTIADGQLPSNNKAGYVIRRILRRGVRYGYTFLGFREPFLYQLMDVLADTFGEVYPEVKDQKSFISKVIEQEEASFLKTLENGLKKLEQITSGMGKHSDKVISGELAFELYDTFGFPLDLTSLIARENGFSVDEKGFQNAMAQQKDRSRSAAGLETGDWVILQDAGEVNFVGYEQLESTAKILRYREIKDKKGKQYQMVLSQTPFYAESGGQVGDTGIISNERETIKVVDTKRENDLIVHIVDKIPQFPHLEVHCEVDQDQRNLTMNNHSATHLLQAALKQVLGGHIQQKGSFVNREMLRFDFAHFAKLSEDELEEVESLVNEKIRENIALEELRSVPIEEAKSMGATALFGEKYGDFVRVVAFDREFSIELCGGTHVSATGKIGTFKVLSESSISAGVRRIEAVTAEKAETFIREQMQLLKEVQHILRNPKNIKKSLEDLIQERNELRKAIEQLQLKEANHLKNQLSTQFADMGDFRLLSVLVKLPNADALKKLAFELKNEQERIVAVLAADIEGKPQIAVVISEELVKEKEYDAGKIVRELAKEIKGGGGGQPFFATAGGKELGGLPSVIELAKKLFSKRQD
ncbi:alanine--tRNA ligase [Pleomorphovibrio marinus]|uniref:alanine--tRNA ligase n=1 Tax=Pleomorphovibrio marinus TaxID=2164132 RepID=UPI000E09F968|nr:alanine--tRNA ligase [Pleomorphovibrio marinus]